MNTRVTERGAFESDHTEQWQGDLKGDRRVDHHAHARSRWRPPALKWLNSVTIALILVITLFLVLGMGCNKSPSSPIGLYWFWPNIKPARGEYVLLAMPLKKIAGMPGDVVTVTAAGTYVNGHPIPNSAPSPRWRHYPYGTFTLGPDQLWVIGNHPLAYDSRYLGPVPATLINAAAKPLITWPNDHADVGN
jgi:type IV secretory pathway protease TraF